MSNLYKITDLRGQNSGADNVASDPAFSIILLH